MHRSERLLPWEARAATRVCGKYSWKWNTGDDDAIYRVPTRRRANKKPIIQKGSNRRVKKLREKNANERDPEFSNSYIYDLIRDVCNGARYTIACSLKWSFPGLIGKTMRHDNNKKCIITDNSLSFEFGIFFNRPTLPPIVPPIIVRNTRPDVIIVRISQSYYK